MISPSDRRVVVHLSLLLATSCWMFACDGDPNENYKPQGGQGGGGTGGAAGTMDSGIPDGSDDFDSGESGADGGMDSSATTPPFTRAGMYAAIGRCAVDRYVDFLAHTEQLVAATGYLSSDPSAAHRNAAQAAYRDALAAWQRAEMFRFGPASGTSEPGGRDLRDNVYFFPVINRCLIDQQLVNQRYAQPNFPTALASSRGLGALEYLLFHSGADNACGPQLGINTMGTWAALTDLDQRRADYAHAAATDIRSRAQTLVNAWSPSGGNFIAQFSAPGGGSVYGDDQAVLTAIITALFYVETVKDAKLSIPLSIPLASGTDCPSAPGVCPDLLESPYARASADNIRQNLTAFRQVFQGCGPGFSGLGIDDWLISIGEGDLARRMIAAIDRADTAAQTTHPTLEQAILATPPTLALNLHAAIKGITDLFKTDLLMVLNVQLPGGGGGDVD